MAKVDKLKEQYKGQIQARTIENLNDFDNTDTKKYLDYMCKLWLEVRNVNTVKKVMSSYFEVEKYVKNKDIYSKDFNTLEKLTKQIEEAEKIKSEKEFDIRERDVLIETNEYILVRPKSANASIKYGQGTRWCTAAKNNNYFNGYARDGYLFYLLRKKETGSIWDKVAFYSKKGSTFSHIKIFASNDTDFNGKSFYNSDWKVDDSIKVVNHINTYMAFDLKKEIIKKKVLDFKKLLEEFDMDDLKTYQKMKEGEDNTVEKIGEVMNEMKEYMGSFV